MKLGGMFKLSWTEFSPYLWVAVAGITGHWAAVGTEKLLEIFSHGHLPQLKDVALSAFYCAIFFLMILQIASRKLFQPQTRRLRTEHAEPREHLILFLSELNEKTFPNIVPDGVSFSGDLNKDIELLAQWKEQHRPLYWPWEMPLRAARHHLRENKLKSLTIICSDRSIRQVCAFGNIMARYAPWHTGSIYVLIQENLKPKRVIFSETPTDGGGWDFDNFDQLSGAMMELLAELRRLGIRDDEIMVDFTGGTKVASVVAAAVTFNRNIKAQYVQTISSTSDKFDLQVIGLDLLVGITEVHEHGLG